MIAVYVNEIGEAAALTEKGSVIIYTHSGAEWKPLREIPFHNDNQVGLAQVRAGMTELIHKLEGCKVFVAKEIAGQLYYLLEASGFESFEAEGNPLKFLDSVNEAVKAVISKKQTTQLLKPDIYFVKTDKDGVYYLNLKEALYRDLSLTSKKLLLPFLQAKEFKELEIVCDHPPGWLEDELRMLKLKTETERIKENEYRIHITAE